MILSVTSLGQEILDVVSDNGYRVYIITASRMASGDLLKYRNRLLIPQS